MSVRVAIASLLCLIGCGPSNGEMGGNDLAATSGDDLATGGAADLATPTSTKNATVSLIAYSSTTQSSTTAAVSFAVGAIPVGGPGCTVTQLDHCLANACTIQAPSDGGASPYTLVGGGTVTISGGPSAITLTESTMYPGYYPPFMATQAWFTGGESFTASSTGATAPAFTIAFTAPTPPVFSPPPSNMFALSRSADLVLTWSGGGAGVLTILIQANVNSTTPGTPFGSVACTFPVGDHSGTVPAAAIAVIPTATAMVSLGTHTTTTLPVGDWLITAQAATFLKTPAGDLYAGGQATVQ